MSGWNGLKATHEFRDEADTIRVSRTFYWAWAQSAVRCPWERVRLLYNAGFRGSDLR